MDEETIKALIEYIREEAEIAIPIKKLFNPDGSHITKKKYGVIVLETLADEIERKFLNNANNEQ